MASFLANAPWEQTLVQLTQQAKFDDVAALAAVTLATAAYATKGFLWAKPDPHAYKLYERPQEQAGAKAAAQQTKNLAERLEQENADIAILWASQSGTSERFAARLAKELPRYFGARVVFAELSDIDPASCALLPESKLAIIVASTFGEGDPSDGMHEFFEYCTHGKGSLSNLRYLAFGLGNSKYKYYNHVIDVVATSLDARGAQALLPTGRADDAAGETEEHFLEWKERVFELFQSKLGYERHEVAYEPSLQIVDDGSLEPIDLYHGIPKDQTNGKSSSKQSKVHALPIVQSRELFKDTNGRNCIHMELDLNEFAELKYKTGDHLGVHPINPTIEVERLLRVLGLESRRSTPCHIKSVDNTPVKVPSPTTINAMFEHYLEVCAPVPRDAVASLASFAPTDAAKEFLTKISTSKDAYHEYLESSYVNLGRLLEHACEGEAAWRDLPLSMVIETLPAMQPRYYSISSSSVVQAKRAAITAVVADSPLTSSDQRIPGLATNYLLALKNSATSPHVTHPNNLTYALPHEHQPLQHTHLHAHIRKSAFKLPVMASTPIMMVGAGTGVAPFRAFVQERGRLKAMGRDVGHSKLFFGCRNPEQDYIYANEFAEQQEKLGDALSLTTAFSRPQNGDKRYVQDCVIDEAEAVCSLLVDNNAYFYICGSAAMARDVTDAVAKIVMTRQGWNEDQMKEFADRQKKQKRWLQDVWG